MSRDLSLLPIEANHNDFGYSHSLLDCQTDYDTWDRIEKLCNKDGQHVPTDFSSFRGRHKDWDDVCYGDTSVDSYGHPILHVNAHKLADCFKIQDDRWIRNKAIVAYLRALPDDYRIALYWH